MTGLTYTATHNNNNNKRSKKRKEKQTKQDKRREEKEEKKRTQTNKEAKQASKKQVFYCFKQWLKQYILVNVDANASFVLFLFRQTSFFLSSFSRLFLNGCLNIYYSCCAE